MNWQGWQDSDLRMHESKSCALPLGYTPIKFATKFAMSIHIFSVAVIRYVGVHWLGRFASG